VSHTHGVDSEFGPLRTVLAHRPGAELKRITPRTRERLLFAGPPWVSRAPVAVMTTRPAAAAAAPSLLLPPRPHLGEH
jgi:hypothetical protein